MIQITDTIAINEDELHYKALYSSGPGGQNVNKNMTAIQLRFDILQSHALAHDVKQRLICLGGSRLNNDFQLIIAARRHRSQERNKREALERLCELIRQASAPPRPRLKKRRSYVANQSRLEQKRRRSETKSLRRRIRTFGD
jgi:ribosome-associated protein